MPSKLAVDNVVSKLPGVHSARIVYDESGEMVEIHVLADITKPAKQLVRDIETAIYASTGIKIDRKIVSIAQISLDSNDEDEAVVRPYQKEEVQGYNFQLTSLETRATTRRLDITVVLDYDGKELEGSSIVDVGDDEKYMAIVESTVAAIREVIPSFRIEFIEKLEYGMTEIVMAVGSSLVNGKRKREAGARLCKKDSLNDFALVVLEIINKI
ncbi:hypothetical protein Theba_0652 [Mesotoga prima MesG1.Ag.4.2]|uniref:Uncharacterized protein n=1 Tax=Mesotoga prima MesG1.Ag.4.2 TaxID=660470 RepID=I2F366_9BACT|nr:MULTISPECIES: hypothetical protein [Mesotoga]AFK06369.1 hypothetical protein Theba_0652 [Mesotoga prima MesG1.Ag.4.2]PIJ62168.1 hypothetical protein V513_06050 [Mesotoga sp. H07.pep.5.3]